MVKILFGSVGDFFFFLPSLSLFSLFFSFLFPLEVVFPIEKVTNWLVPQPTGGSFPVSKFFPPE